MPSSYTSLLYHLIFGTKGRRPLITRELQQRLYEYIGGIVSREEGRLIAVGGVQDHIHMLVSIPPTKAVSDFLRIVKTNSSKWIHETFRESTDFGWQDGYGAFSVSKSGIDDVRAYIATQEEHHRRVSFEEEFVAFLKRNEIEFDERYLWK